MFKALLDLIYPPLCVHCREPSETLYLCPECWQLCTPLDPIDHCRHCFEPLEVENARCSQCRWKPVLTAPRAFVFAPGAPIVRWLSARAAMGGYAFYQWVQLDWEVPDLILPLPDSDSIEIGKEFALLMERPFFKAFRSCDQVVELKKELKEEQAILLFDCSNSIEKLQSALRELSDSGPKKVFILTLIQKTF